ncbi:hypothetical protein BGW38_002369 [Lunasporangiospora selenospora]|uniref:non-specific serine/threonine protein kinase n=1 Tax=Lunasporangiospora selenospora TaxID=979761 RepID=A0A9P6FSU5_9FUNG|nr:hypothetical protein BGW38_002369 [Lunasporangiospora selenospora]
MYPEGSIPLPSTSGNLESVVVVPHQGHNTTTTSGSKKTTTVTGNKTTTSNTTSSSDHAGPSTGIVAGIAGVVMGVGAAAAAHLGRKESKVDEKRPTVKTSSSTTKLTTTTGVTKTTTTTVNGQKTTTTRSSSENSRIAEGIALAGGAVAAGTIIHQHQSTQQQPPQQIIVTKPGSTSTANSKTQITLRLSIIRYERSDAAQATPFAKPGTMMFSQMEMLGTESDISITGSKFSHVRDSSKVTGQEQGLPSPVVPGPSGAGTSTESEPRERSLRWMQNELQWKREAGMLQHLRSERHVAELFTLYSLPALAEYRFVSVMGPFTRTLESYLKERHGSGPVVGPNAVPRSTPGLMTAVELKNLTENVTSAVKWCHDHHVVHLNLSPASIFLQEFYSEPDVVDNQPPKVEQQWKLWNFSHSRFDGEAVDLNMETNAYTAPEILVACKRHTKRIRKVTTVTKSSGENPETSTSTNVSTEGGVTTTTTTKTTKGSSSSTAAQSSVEMEKVVADISMDMWSLGEIIYELQTNQAMFESGKDALSKLSAVMEKRHGSGEGDSDSDDDSDGDLDNAKGHDRARQQLQDKIEMIDSIEDHGAREVIKGLLEVQPDRRLKHEEIRTLYLDLPV